MVTNMPSRILRTDKDREAFTRFLASFDLPCTVTVIKGARRSNPQNATAHAWYAQIGAEYGMTPAEAKALCKLTHGLPIMEAENPAWVAEWSPLYAPLPYEMQRKLFEAIPLTSKLSVRQMSAYMNAVQAEYRAQGVALIDPEARIYEAEMGVRI